MNLRLIGCSLCAVVALACTGTRSGPDDGTATSSGGPGPVGPHACDPLVGADAPLTLGNIVGAGRHADGTLYVADDGGHDRQRVFISNGTVLQRFVVAGSGATGENLTLSIASPAVTLRIDNPGPRPTSMSVVRGKLDDRKIEDTTKADALEIVGTEALAGFTIKNVPDNVVVEYNASLPDGRRLFVSRPEVDWSYEDFRIFFGTPNDMLERPLVEAARGSTTFITFTVDGAEYKAVIPSSSLGDPAPATLTSGTEKVTLTLLPTDATSRANLAFVCTK